MSLFDYTPHPRVEERKEQGPVTVADQLRDASGRFRQFNATLALRITNRVGTMGCAYIFMCLSLVSLPAAILSHSAIIIVGWVAQTFLQLVLLPVIMVGQNVQAKAADKRASQVFDDVEAILHELRELQNHLHVQDEILVQAGGSNGT